MDPSQTKKLGNGNRFLLACLLAVVSCSLLAASGPAARLKTKSSFQAQNFKQTLEQTAPSFQEVSVHDPSVIEVDGTYYIFGSHLAAAKTTDLMNWEGVADGVDENNPLFENVVVELEETFLWSDAIGLWANEVIQLEDGRFYMYHNLSRLDSPRASLGLAVADHVEGLYVNHGIFLQSGMWDQISEDGVNIYDPRIHPNTVDPDAFFDQEGKLWMVYGSFSGGIFIMEMNPETGFPFEGQGYGKHLMGGNHSRIEGPYILFSPHSGYYYLFTSFGGLTADGAYNMRVARSRNPDGPYYDALGNDMADVKSNPALPLFDDASIEPYAQKLMGNHFFLKEAGEPGIDTGFGYTSPGHNSAFYDSSTGQYFLIFHTRFPGMGEMHQVRVHEMFINEDGWPVVAPHRYVPYRFMPYGDAPYRVGEYPFFMDRCPQKPWCWNFGTVRTHEILGEYKLVNHGKDISAEVKLSEPVSLHSDGTVSGSVSGTWFRPGGMRITIEIDGLGVFKGMLSRGWNETSQQFVVTFTAMSVEGVSIWGSQPARH